MRPVLRINALQAGILIAGMFVIFSFVFQTANEYYHKRFRMVTAIEAPFTHHGDDKRDRYFVGGSPVYIHYRAKFERPCERLINQMRLFRYSPQPEPGVTSDVDSVYSWPAYYNSIAKAGIYDYSEHLVLPERLMPGQYVIRRYSFLDCEGYRWTEIYPDASLVIVR